MESIDGRNSQREKDVSGVQMKSLAGVLLLDHCNETLLSQITLLLWHGFAVAANGLKMLLRPGLRESIVGRRMR